MILSQDFWGDSKSALLLSPHLSSDTRRIISDSLAQYLQPGCVYLKSSGTESSQRGIKIVEISKQAVLVAATSVNDFLGLNNQHCWLNSLPQFHIGGLAVGARCFLSGCREIFLGSWSAEEFLSQCQRHDVTHSSLVPTQVYDLVRAQLPGPESLQAILVGGGAIDDRLLLQARRLGWPLLPSYGMTETCALVAASPIENANQPFLKPMKVLGHISLRPSAGKWIVEGQCLFERFLWIDRQGEVQPQPRSEPFVIDDRLSVEGDALSVLARQSELVKILGESVNLKELAEKLSLPKATSFILWPRPDERAGFRLHLIIESSPFELNLAEINQGLLPFERIEQIHFVTSFPRSELGKLLRYELFSQVESLLKKR